MHRSRFAVATLVLALAIPIASAQQNPPTKPPQSSQSDAELVGLPVYTSDGLKLGQVTNAARSHERAALVAELDEFQDVGSISLVIDDDVYQRKTDRIELLLTAAEVKDAISQQQQKRRR
jgi:hypothetical protein